MATPQKPKPTFDLALLKVELDRYNNGIRSTDALIASAEASLKEMRVTRDRTFGAKIALERLIESIEHPAPPAPKPPAKP